MAQRSGRSAPRIYARRNGPGSAQGVGPDGGKGAVAAAVAEKVRRQTTYLANVGAILATTCDVLIVDRSVDPM